MKTSLLVILAGLGFSIGAIAATPYEISFTCPQTVNSSVECEKAARKELKEMNCGIQTNTLSCSASTKADQPPKTMLCTFISTNCRLPYLNTLTKAAEMRQCPKDSEKTRGHRNSDKTNLGHLFLCKDKAPAEAGVGDETGPPEIAGSAEKR
ncbi:hypothetical protein K2X30_09595 [bacterium]|jgi:hypothetical protein|nr:hypothetical protein [bacterium]